ncbi:hypothetical protein [Okeania sp. SIO1I7]|uniref:hypothetical protein n=1 Tax=Okeania sp. SIO1I7 TaxID=2607772 RepID=UPI0013F84F8E|nr:hypothetical protein [Okeania sp. SIO1I7]NET29096.1 hypothetical protein [Okeania sp. SIO1I7]
MENIVQINPERQEFVPFNYFTNLSKKVAKVGFLQAVRNSGEGYFLTIVHNHIYRPVESATGVRARNPFDGRNGNGTGGTTKARINLMSDTKNTLWSVSFDYYKNLVSYSFPETHIQHFLEPLMFFKWYLFVAFNMIIAYPTIRAIETEFPKQGEKLKNWYATTYFYEEAECDIVTD